ncbi:hypothetical protein P378_08960 [Desulforamulus profundi]|uniref:Uncharacterized protein n=1 Tax=Desulforamulus profundi TaxID=1383067 RepID=A0A2C6MBQ6_9FIRM|nr:hypothetical protein P378_08960 [Desulforamulus profundi]
MAAHYFLFVSNQIFSNVCKTFQTEIGAGSLKNIIDYTIEENDTFKNRKFNAVDSLVLSQLAYLRFDKFVPGLSDTAMPVSIKEIASKENLDMLFRDTWNSKNNRRLFFALANSSRFRDLKMVFYVNKIDNKTEKQFSAITFLLDDCSAYIAYRGTDSTFIGWKEDFNMAFISLFPRRKKASPT